MERVLGLSHDGHSRDLQLCVAPAGSTRRQGLALTELLDLSGSFVFQLLREFQNMLPKFRDGLVCGTGLLDLAHGRQLFPKDGIHEFVNGLGGAERRAFVLALEEFCKDRLLLVLGQRGDGCDEKFVDRGIVRGVDAILRAISAKTCMDVGMRKSTSLAP